jgi:hypothetical protein
MAVFDPAQTIQSLITQLCDLDATHTTELTTTTTVKTFENVFQINWGRGSLIRLTLTTNSMTPSGVRLKAALGPLGPGAVISSLSPATCANGAAQFTLTVNGFGLVPGSTIIFRGVNLGALTYVTDQQNTILVPASSVVAPAATVAVQVQAPGISVPLSNIANFIIT